MSRSLFLIYPVRPHYLGCLQLSQLPATPPSKAPAPQPFPNVRYLRMCLGKETAGKGSTCHCRHCRKPGGRVTKYLLGASAEHLQTQLLVCVFTHAHAPTRLCL